MTTAQWGLQLSERRAIVPVGKGTLTGWLKDVELTATQRGRNIAKMRDRGTRGRQIGAWRNRQKSRQRAERAKLEARREFPRKVVDPLFLTGVALWWAEGAKTQRHFQFVNSDPKAIRVVVKWLTQCAGVPKRKIVVSVQVHRIYANHGFGTFWRKVTGLPQPQFRSPVFNPTPHTVKKNPSYIGCCRLSVFSTELFWKLQAWHQALVRLLGIRLPPHTLPSQ